MNKNKIKKIFAFFLIIVFSLFISKFTFAEQLKVSGLEQNSQDVFCELQSNEVDCVVIGSGDFNIVSHIYIDTQDTTHLSSSLNLVFENNTTLILDLENNSQDKVIFGSTSNNLNFSKLILDGAYVNIYKNEHLLSKFSLISYIESIELNNNSMLNIIYNSVLDLNSLSAISQEKYLKNDIETSINNSIIFGTANVDFSRTKIKTDISSNFIINTDLYYKLYSLELENYFTNNTYCEDSFITTVYNPNEGDSQEEEGSDGTDDEIIFGYEDIILEYEKYTYQNESNTGSNSNIYPYVCRLNLIPEFKKYLTFSFEEENKTIFYSVDNNGSFKVTSNAAKFNINNQDGDRLYQIPTDIFFYNYSGDKLPAIISSVFASNTDDENLKSKVFLKTCEVYSSRNLPFITMGGNDMILYFFDKMYYVAPDLDIEFFDYGLIPDRFQFIEKSCETNFVPPTQELAGNYVSINTNKKINPYLFGSIKGDNTIYYDQQFNDVNLKLIVPPNILSELSMNNINNSFVIYKDNFLDIPEVDFLKYYNIYMKFNYNDLDVNLNNVFSIYKN